MDKNIVDGPTGETCLDLPSPYQAHPCGLLHLPRFLAKNVRTDAVGQKTVPPPTTELRTKRSYTILEEAAAYPTSS